MTALIDKLKSNPLLLVAAAVVAAIGLYLTQPWQHFIDTTVDEAFPISLTNEVMAADLANAVADAEMADDVSMNEPKPMTGMPDADESDGDPEMMVEEPSLLARATFMDRSHPTSGEVGIFEVMDGTRILRIEDLETDNGPDLFVYLSTAGADAGSGDFDDDFINLGRLKGNLGSQNYEIPADVDLSKYSSIVIWCDRFDVAFGAGQLTTA